MRFLVRFSPSDGYERVDNNKFSEYVIPYLNISNIVHFFTFIKRRKLQEKLEACKQPL